MALFDADALPRARRLSQLVYCNPFLSERIEHERSVLGADFDEATADWNLHADWPTPLPNIERLAAISVALADAARERLTRGHRPDAPALEPAELVAWGREQGLRLHKFKRNAELPRVRRVLGALSCPPEARPPKKHEAPFGASRSESS